MKQISNYTFRCNCSHNPVFAEFYNGLVVIKKRGGVVASRTPCLVKCGNCGQWYEIMYNGFCKKLDEPEAQNKLEGICTNCGHFYQPNSVQICPKCTNKLPVNPIQ